VVDIALILLVAVVIQALMLVEVVVLWQLVDKVLK
tara:strand:+ start:191 stop:295 length:105 start_codon:yes stop_codon:yes gene_type:complete